MPVRLLCLVALLVPLAGHAEGLPKRSTAPALTPAAVVVPFDFARFAIGLDVTVKGRPLYMLLDTGVDPSLIDLDQARALGLPVDRHDGGEASGFGAGKGATVFPSRIEGLAIGGRGFARFDALASDMRGISTAYGRRLDGVLGLSFLQDKAVLIDYPHRRLAIFTRAGEAASTVGTCRLRWSVPLRTVEGFPVIPGFRLGAAAAPVSFDTGANGSIGLFRSALELPGVRAAMTERGTVEHTGARGAATGKGYVFDAPVGFGPFTLPPGQPATLHAEAQSVHTRVANIGNRLMDAAHVQVLIDYRGRALTFYGDCRDGGKGAGT
jgi:hypothetical protein